MENYLAKVCYGVILKKSCRKFKYISLGAAFNICKLFENTGFVNNCTPTYENRRSLNDEQELWIMGLLVNNPSLYLGEICQKVHHAFNIEVSASTIC